MVIIHLLLLRISLYEYHIISLDLSAASCCNYSCQLHNNFNSTAIKQSWTVKHNYSVYLEFRHVFRYMIQLTMKPSSGCLRKIKDKSLTSVILKYTKIYSSWGLELVTPVHVVLWQNVRSSRSRLEYISIYFNITVVKFWYFVLKMQPDDSFKVSRKCIWIPHIYIYIYIYIELCLTAVY